MNVLKADSFEKLLKILMDFSSIYAANLKIHIPKYALSQSNFCSKVGHFYVSLMPQNAWKWQIAGMCLMPFDVVARKWPGKVQPMHTRWRWTAWKNLQVAWSLELLQTKMQPHRVLSSDDELTMNNARPRWQAYDAVRCKGPCQKEKCTFWDKVLNLWTHPPTP